MKPRRITSAGFTIALTFGLVTAQSPLSHAQGHDPIVIAVEAPLSGAQSSNGIDMLRGVRLAVRQVNASGGVLGRKVSIVTIDDKADPNLAKSSVKKATKADAFAVIGPYNSSVGVLNLPLYLDSKIVPVHMTSTNDTDGDGITVQPKNDQIAPIEFDYVRSSGVTSVSMLVDPSLYTQGMADRLASSLQAIGVTVTQIPIPEGKDDYTAEVAQAVANEPSMVYVSTYYPEGARIAQALQSSPVASSTACLMGLANVDASFINEAGLPASQHCVFSGVPTAEEMPGKRAAAFVREYKKAFGSDPGVWGIFTYDSARVLFDAIEEAGTARFAATMKKLKRTKNYKGATGTISIDPTTGNRKVVPVYILEVNSSGAFVITS
ncbi:MAG: branched-chain amino acid ABC transporter substrate-binding protein [Actinomycetota bacterium]|nr:branched-chain amino acid ABC transporter substrate-binding protein [Actinomycetota bacterium]